MTYAFQISEINLEFEQKLEFPYSHTQIPLFRSLYNENFKFYVEIPPLSSPQPPHHHHHYLCYHCLVMGIITITPTIAVTATITTTPSLTTTTTLTTTCHRFTTSSPLRTSIIHDDTIITTTIKTSNSRRL